MAANHSASMNASFAQGSVDCTYISIIPNRMHVQNPPLERLTWPRYQHAEEWIDPPFLEAHVRQAGMPVEFLTTVSGR
jgi:hypothetical protein